jgi:hypothetical protein
MLEINIRIHLTIEKLIPRIEIRREEPGSDALRAFDTELAKIVAELHAKRRKRN